MTEARRESNADWPAWMHEAWNRGVGEEGRLFPAKLRSREHGERLIIHTLEGDHLVSWGDYIIKGVNGELYPCKPEIFEATYEAVTDENVEA